MGIGAEPASIVIAYESSCDWSLSVLTTPRPENESRMKAAMPSELISLAQASTLLPKQPAKG